MTPLYELVLLLSEKNRRIFVAGNPIDFTVDNGSNSVYVLDLPEASPGSAGGRIGGVGERKITRLICFRQHNGRWTKVYETEDRVRLNELELPYHATGLSVILPDGTQRVVSGVVDEEFVLMYEGRK